MLTFFVMRVFGNCHRTHPRFRHLLLMGGTDSLYIFSVFLYEMST